MNIFKKLFCKHEYEPTNEFQTKRYTSDGYVLESYETSQCTKCGHKKTELILSWSFSTVYHPDKPKRVANPKEKE